MDNIRYTHRFLARIVVEAETPLAVGSGNHDVITDSLVATDVNGLPYIPATTIAGVFRSMTELQEGELAAARLFGFQKGDKGKGSDMIFTDAKILGHDGQVIDGLVEQSVIEADKLLKHYDELPVRQHVRISDRGVAATDTYGKFDEQVVYAGSRFCFEVEMLSDNPDDANFLSVLGRMADRSFRIGGGTRRGFGKIAFVDVRTCSLDLTKKDDREKYLGKPSSLDSKFWNDVKSDIKKLTERNNGDSDSWIVYDLALSPESFFLFGSGFGDDDADMTPVKAKKVIWTNSDREPVGTLVENLVLIPATSVKGALSHRVAYHWNRLNRIYADTMSPEEFASVTGENNPAVKALFGAAVDRAGDGNDVAVRGNVILSDIIRIPEQSRKTIDKIFNHVSIDRFTGGAIDGALFSEKATWDNSNEEYKTTIMVDLDGLNRSGMAQDERDTIIEALDCAIRDIRSGRLPLGGRVNHGHGAFTGIAKKNNELLI